MLQNKHLMEYANKVFERLRDGGVLVTSIGKDGRSNVMTIGWCLLGWQYHRNPISIIAVRPATHTFKLLDEIGEFVVAVPGPELKEAVAFCGRESGRNVEKFKATGLTKEKSVHVKPPSIKECCLNIENIYHKERPPHQILTPEHRSRAVSEQHTIYFAEVLGAYATEGE